MAVTTPLILIILDAWPLGRLAGPARGAPPRPPRKEARNNLGILLARRGDLEGAILQFQGALAVQPRAADVLYNLGLTLEHLGRATEARASYRRALTLDPGAEDARAALGRLAAGVAKSD